MLQEVEAALSHPRQSEIQLLYKQVLGKEFKSNCGDCYNDAKIELQAWVNEQRRMNTDIILFLSYYVDKNPERQEEIEHCYALNKANTLIKDIVYVEGRLFNDFFEVIKNYPNSVNIISNADIVFNDTIEQAKAIKNFEMYALTRYNYNGNGHADFFNRADSQDCWIFRGTPKKVVGDFGIGYPGSDNRLAYNFRQAGYIIRNPSLSIQTIHYHLVKGSNYTDADRLPEPYLLLKPSLL